MTTMRHFLLLLFLCPLAFAGIPANTVTVIESSAANQTARPLSVGRHFSRGEIAFGSCAEAVIGGSAVVTQMDVKTRWWEEVGGVTAATNATPIAITVSRPHLLASSDWVMIAGVKGNPAANGLWSITSTGSSTFTLTGSVGNGAYTSGGVATSNARGSVQQAVVSWRSNYTASSSTVVTFRPTKTACDNTAMTKAAMLAFNESSGGAADGWNARIQATANAETKGPTARTLLNSLAYSECALENWLAGPVVTAVVIKDWCRETYADTNFGWRYDTSAMNAEPADWTVNAATLTSITAAAGVATATVDSTTNLRGYGIVRVTGCTLTTWNSTFMTNANPGATTFTFTVPAALNGTTCNNAGAAIANRSFRTVLSAFVLYFYPGATNYVLAEYRLENPSAMSQDQNYTTLALQHGTSAYSSWLSIANAPLRGRSRIMFEEWVTGSTPTLNQPLAVRVDHNIEYLVYSKAIPPMRFSGWTASETALNSTYTAHPTKGRIAACAAIPCTATELSDGYDLVPSSGVDYEEPRAGFSIFLRTFSAAMYKYMLGGGRDYGGVDVVGGAGVVSAALHNPVYPRGSRITEGTPYCGTAFCSDVDTTGALPVNRPWSRQAEGNGVAVESLGATANCAIGTFVCRVGQMDGSVFGTTYQRPMYAHGIFRLTGRWNHYQDVMLVGGKSHGAHAESTGWNGTGPTLQGVLGAAQAGNNRDHAYHLGVVSQAAEVAADGSIEKEYFSQVLLRNIAHWEGFFDDRSGAFPPLDSSCAGYNRTTTTSAWCWGKYTNGGLSSNGATDTTRYQNNIGMPCAGATYNFGVGDGASGPIHSFNGTTGLESGVGCSFDQAGWQDVYLRLTLANTAWRGDFPVGAIARRLLQFPVEYQRQRRFLIDIYQYCARIRANATAAPAASDRYPFTWTEFFQLVPATLWNAGGTGTNRWRYINSSGGNCTVEVDDDSLFGSINFTYADNATSTATRAWPMADSVNAGTPYFLRVTGANCTATDTVGPFTPESRRDKTLIHATLEDGYGMRFYSQLAMASVLNVVTPLGVAKDAASQAYSDIAASVTTSGAFNYLASAEPARTSTEAGDTFAVFRITAPTSTACTVKVDDNADFATPIVNSSDSGVARYREFVATGLSASTAYFTRVTCADDPFVSGNADGSLTTLATLTGTADLSVAVGPGEGTVTLDHGATAALGSTASNASCASGCIVTATAVTRGVRYTRLTRGGRVGAIQAGVHR